jgi:hypothetical protein
MSRSITSQAMTSHQGEDVREWSSGISDEQKECFRPASSGEVSGKQLSLFNSFILFLRVHYLTMLLNAEIIWHRYTWINEWMNEFEALGNTEILGENPSQCLFVCRKCYMDRPGTEPEPRWWQALASSSIPSTVNDFFFFHPSYPLGTGWYFLVGKNGWGVKTTHFCKVRGLRMRGPLPPLHHIPSWHRA